MELFFIQRLLGFERGFACDSRVVRWILFPDLPLSYEQNGLWPNMTSNSGIPKGWHLGLLLFATQINNVLSVSKCSIYTLIQQQSLIAATPSFYLVADPSLYYHSLAYDDPSVLHICSAQICRPMKWYSTRMTSGIFVVRYFT